MEVKDLLELINVEPPEEGEELDINAVRAKFDEQFIPISEVPRKPELWENEVKSRIGQRIGSIQTDVIKKASALGIDMKHADFKDKTVEETIEAMYTGLESVIKQKPKGDDAANKELERIKAEAAEYKQKLTEYETQLSTVKTEYENDKKNWHFNKEENDAWGNVRFASEVLNEKGQYRLKGFKSDLKEKYKLDVIDDKVFPVYADPNKKGSRVSHPVNANKHLTYSELIAMEAENAGLIAKAHDGKKVSVGAKSTDHNGGGDSGSSGRRLPRRV